jgi:hypothetical protein
VYDALKAAVTQGNPEAVEICFRFGPDPVPMLQEDLKLEKKAAQRIARTVADLEQHAESGWATKEERLEEEGDLECDRKTGRGHRGSHSLAEKRDESTW